MRRRVRRWTLVALVVWIVLVTWWALSPVSDTVPTGSIKHSDGVIVLTTQAVDCGAPLSGSATSTDSLPELTGGRKYERTPCELAHDNDRLIFAVDILVAIAVVALLVKTWKPSEPPEPSDEPEAPEPLDATTAS